MGQLVLHVKPINIPLILLSFSLFLGLPVSRGVRDGGGQALWSVPQAEALGSVAQVEVANVEDGFQGRGVRRIRSHK